MALNSKILAQGNIESVRTTLYTVTLKDAIAKIKFFCVVNTHTEQVCLSLYASTLTDVNQPNSHWPICPEDMILDGGDTLYLIDDGQEMDLPNASGIFGEASIGDVLKFTITGEEGKP